MCATSPAPRPATDLPRWNAAALGTVLALLYESPSKGTQIRETAAPNASWLDRERCTPSISLTGATVPASKYEQPSFSASNLYNRLSRRDFSQPSLYISARSFSAPSGGGATSRSS